MDVDVRITVEADAETVVEMAADYPVVSAETAAVSFGFWFC